MSYETETPDVHSRICIVFVYSGLGWWSFSSCSLLNSVVVTLQRGTSACNFYSNLLNALQEKGLSLNQQSLHMQVGRGSSKFQPSIFSSLIAWRHAIPIGQLSLSTRLSFQNSDTKPFDQMMGAMSMDGADVGRS